MRAGTMVWFIIIVVVVVVVAVFWKDALHGWDQEPNQIGFSVTIPAHHMKETVAKRSPHYQPSTPNMDHSDHFDGFSMEQKG